MTDILREKLGEIRADFVDREYVDVPMLLDSLEIALGALDKLREGWLYWPAKHQPDPRTVMYHSKTIDNIERMGREAIARIQERMGR